MSTNSEFVQPNKRAIILAGVAADKKYDFSVRAYRMVDADIDPTGVIYSTLTVAKSRQYKPADKPSFAGNVTGTIMDVAASQVISDLRGITADNMLSRVEKPQLVLTYNQITASYTASNAKAAQLGGIETVRNAAVGAFTALNTYLGTLTPPWADLSKDTPIDQVAFQSAFASAFSTLADLDAAIADRASTTAQWSGVSGSGKPENDATKGGTLGNTSGSGNIINPSGGFYWRNELYTPNGISAGFTGQGALASLSSLGYGSSLLTGFAALATQAFAMLGSPYLRRADGSTSLTEFMTITSLGTANSILNQGTGATANNLSQLDATAGVKLTGIDTGATAGDNLVKNSRLDNNAEGFLTSAKNTLTIGAVGDPVARYFTNTGNATAGMSGTAVIPAGAKFLFVTYYLKRSDAQQITNDIMYLDLNGSYLTSDRQNDFDGSVIGQWMVKRVKFAIPERAAAFQFNNETTAAGPTRIGGYHISLTEREATVGADVSSNVKDNGSLISRIALITSLGTANSILNQGTGATANNLSQLDGPAGTKLNTVQAGATADVRIGVAGTNPQPTVLGNQVQKLDAQEGYNLNGDNSGTAAYVVQPFAGSIRVFARHMLNGQLAQLSIIANGMSSRVRDTTFGIRTFADQTANVFMGDTDLGRIATQLDGNSTYAIEYNGSQYKAIIDGNVRYTTPAASGQTFYAAMHLAGYASGWKDVNVATGTRAAKTGEFLFDANNAILTDGLIKTSLGTASSVNGQTEWATYTGMSTSTMVGKTGNLSVTGFFASFLNITDRKITQITRADGSTEVTEQLVVTQMGVAAAISGQDWGATASQASAANSRVAIGANSIVNSGFAKGTNYWRAQQFGVGLNYPGYFGRRQVAYLHGTDGIFGSNSGVNVDVMPFGPWYGAMSEAPRFALPVTDGERIGARVLVACHRCDAELYILFFNKDGTLNQAESLGRQNYGPGGGQNGENFRTVEIIRDAAPGAAYAQFMLRCWANGQGDPYMFFSEPQLVKMAPGQTVIPAYTNGPSDPLADQTGTNIAAGINGQGGLATQDVVGAGNIAASAVQVVSYLVLTQNVICYRNT